MKSIVAVDGSEQSQLIIHHLRALAPFDDMVLLHAYDVPQLAYPGTGMGVGHDYSVKAEEALRKDGNRILEDMSSQLQNDVGPIHRKLERGPTAEIILSVAQQENADLIIIGSRGLGIIREHALGSVSHRVVFHASCATLVVKNRCDSFQHILVPLEHTTDAERIVSFLKKHPFRGTVTLTLLHVIPFAQPILPVSALIPESCQKDLRAGAEQFTNAIAAQLILHGYSTSTIVKTGAPSLVIHEEAQRLGINLILMSRQQRARVSRFFLGSVSHSIVHHTTCSILLLP